MNEFARILLNEHDAEHFKKLSQKTVGDFIELKKNLTAAQKALEKRFQEIGDTRTKDKELIEKHPELKKNYDEWANS